MRVLISDLETSLGKEVLVFVDKVRVAYPIEVDTKEGWCIAREYHLSSNHRKLCNRKNKDAVKRALNEASTKKDDDLLPISFEEIKLVGEVKIAYWETKDDPSPS